MEQREQQEWEERSRGKSVEQTFDEEMARFDEDRAKGEARLREMQAELQELKEQAARSESRYEQPPKES